MVAWEYARMIGRHHSSWNAWTFTWLGPDGNEVETEESEQSALSHAGADGWELVEITRESSGSAASFTFKRPLRGDSKPGGGERPHTPPSQAYSNRRSVSEAQYVARINDFTSSTLALARLMREFDRLLRRHTLARLANRPAEFSIDMLVAHLDPTVEQYSIQTHRYLRVLGELDQDNRDLLDAAGSTTQGQWSAQATQYLESIRVIAESALEGVAATEKLYVSLATLKGKSQQLDGVLERMQSLLVKKRETRNTFQHWLTGVEALLG